MNKKTFNLLLLSLLTLPIFAQSFSYKINGVLDQGYNGKKVYIQQLNEARNGLMNSDSTIVQNGQFSFNKTADNDKSIRFITTEEPITFAPIVFIPEKGQINISAKDSVKIWGTPRNDEYQKFTNSQNELQDKVETVINYYKTLSQTSDNYNKRVNAMEPLVEEMAKQRFDYAQANIQNELGEFIALTSVQILPPDRILELVYQMRPSFKDSNLGKEVISYYEAELSKTPGANFKDIVLTDPMGKEVKLSDYAGKGKIVLVDFWASWCGPCIKEMPTIVEAYNKYKDKGFEIVGVSMDDNQASWIKSIEKLNITWPQMSDLKGWKSSAALAYGINSIPFTLLLDGDGKIIDSNLRGEELSKKLSQLLD